MPPSTRHAARYGRFLVPVALLVSALFASGCALLGQGSGEEARRLVAEAEAYVDERQFVEAYERVKELRTRFPESEEAIRAFPTAAALYKKVYYRKRYTEPESSWLTAEPAFLFRWLEEHYDERFPQDEVDALLIGMPYSFSQTFAEHARRRSAMALWKVRVTEDNGIIQSVTAVRRDPPEIGAPAP